MSELSPRSQSATLDSAQRILGVRPSEVIPFCRCDLLNVAVVPPGLFVLGQRAKNDPQG